MSPRPRPVSYTHLDVYKRQPLDKVVTGRVWRYELEPVEGGTIVRETWDISREAPLSRPVVRRMMAASTRENMARTLERIASVVAEAGLGSV